MFESAEIVLIHGPAAEHREPHRDAVGHEGPWLAADAPHQLLERDPVTPGNLLERK